MQVSSKMVIISVSIFITLLIISTVILITNMSVTSAKNSSKYIARINKEIQNDFKTYDQTMIAPEDMIKFIDEYSDQYIVVLESDNRNYSNLPDSLLEQIMGFISNDNYFVKKKDFYYQLGTNNFFGTAWDVVNNWDLYLHREDIDTVKSRIDLNKIYKSYFLKQDLENVGIFFEEVK